MQIGEVLSTHAQEEQGSHVARAAGTGGADAYHGPSTSIANRIGRAIWAVVYWGLFRTTPRPAHAWRAFLLRVFGAKLGRGCRIYAGATVWAPWNLKCEDYVAVADGAIIYNPATITLRSHVTISQQAFLCGASHDYNDPGFPMIWMPIEIGPYAWIAARASVQMGVRVGEGAVLGFGANATRDLEAWSVYAGSPARRVATRRCFLSSPGRG